MDLRIKDVIDSMADDLRLNPSLGEMAESVYLSPSRFSHLFKLEPGVPPRQYLKRLRIKKAKELLETTWMKVRDIIAAVGVTEPSHFVRDFRKLHGLSPANYRIRYRSRRNRKTSPANI